MSKKYKLLIVCILSYIKSDLTFIMRKSGKTKRTKSGHVPNSVQLNFNY